MRTLWLYKACCPETAPTVEEEEEEACGREERRKRRTWRKTERRG